MHSRGQAMSGPLPAELPPLGQESDADKLFRKAAHIRRACFEAGLCISPDGKPIDFETLPPGRKARWLRLAAVYLEIFG